MTGRPPCYTAELAQRVLDDLSAGRTLGEVCRDDDTPSEMTVRKWVQEDTDGFAARYRAARQAGLAVAPGQVRYSRQVADAVTEALTRGRTLAEVCGEIGMPSTNTIARWVAEDRDGFAGRYRLARHTGHGRVGQIAHSSEVEELILRELMTGRTLTAICRDPDMPALGSVQSWLSEDRNGFAARYRRAREIGCDIVADEMVDIADDRDRDWILRHHQDGTVEAILDAERVSRARLRFEARRWRLSKMLPRTYGERLDLTARNDGGQHDRESWADLLKEVDGKTRFLPNKPHDDE